MMNHEQKYKLINIAVALVAISNRVKISNDPALGEVVDEALDNILELVNMTRQTLFENYLGGSRKPKCL